MGGGSNYGFLGTGQPHYLPTGHHCFWKVRGNYFSLVSTALGDLRELGKSGQLPNLVENTLEFLTSEIFSVERRWDICTAILDRHPDVINCLVQSE